MEKYIAVILKTRIIPIEVKATNKKEAKKKAIKMAKKNSDGGSNFTLFNINKC